MWHKIGLRWSLFFLCFSIFSCTDTSRFTEIGLGNHEYEVAFPLVNSRISLTRIQELAKGKTSIKFDSDGRTTVVYNGEVLRKNSAAIFPPFPGGTPFVIDDTLAKVEILPLNKYVVRKAIFKGTKINFSGQNTVPEDIHVKMSIKELTKNGKPFITEFDIPYTNSLPVRFQTPDISVDGWTLTSSKNSMTFIYEATTSSGHKIILDQAFMNYDLIKFSYIEGYLGYHLLPIDGNFINVHLFDNWISGNFDFENPKITISVDNAFGLPVRSKVNKLELTSITGNTVTLQSPFIDTGIDFKYPSFGEVGQVKTTYFDFNKDNSNIREIFNEKTKTISYDIDAVVNPERDTSTNGFITDDNFFVVNVAAEIPLLGSVHQVVLADTLDIALDAVSNVHEASFKIILSNDFPAELSFQSYFADNTGTIIDSLFNGKQTIQAAVLGNNGRTLKPSEKTVILTVTKEKYDKLRGAKRMILNGTINTTGSENRNALWVYDDYGVGVKIGAKLKVTTD
ncbi:MAG: hypothetical protein J5I52_09240 [Saprospiraceae bacterium]|nr:MAG: hypothetical protein UZ09_BCD002001264 [Bacteroidetes bacterium OLB9]MCO6464320.1 hypothetical protein [Saprospiraceae bacterium]MCZ2338298.1 hypothetical protein [Chitinophagales bacterium]